MGFRSMFSRLTGISTPLFGISWAPASQRDAIAAAAEPSSRLFQLPPDIADFEGRDEQVSRLLELLSQEGGRASITAIGGMGGIGKTVLASHVGHQLVDRYPDGQLFVEMRGTSDEPLTPAAVMVRVIQSFNPAAQLPESVEELQPIYRSTLHEKRALIVLDNAHDSAQVEPLLPPATCALLVTSRRKIVVPGVASIDLDVMPEPEAVKLLRSLVGPDRASDEELAEISQLCGYLPLALRVAGSFLQLNTVWSPADYIEALREERSRLQLLVLEGSAELDVAASLIPSVRQLRQDNPEAADRWHALSVFPGGFDLPAAAAVWGTDLEEARGTITALAARAMVRYDERRKRFRLHDLMRDLAAARARFADQLMLPEDLPQRLGRAAAAHSAHFAQVLAAADRLFLEGDERVLRGLTLFDQERSNIETGQTWAAQTGAEQARAKLCLKYPDAGANVLNLRLVPRHRVAWLESAIAAACQLDDRAGEGSSLANLGLAYSDLGETKKAIEIYEQALSICRKGGDRAGEGGILGNLGLAYADLGETKKAIEIYEQALDISREIGDRRAEGNDFGNLGLAYAALSETRKAIGLYEQQLKIVREIGDRRGEGNALGNLGFAYADLGETRKAIECAEQTLGIFTEIEDPRADQARRQLEKLRQVQGEEGS